MSSLVSTLSVVFRTFILFAVYILDCDITPTDIAHYAQYDQVKCEPRNTHKRRRVDPLHSL